jgi:Fur family transcriptional regulator, ferric uptake regulator
MGPRPSAPTSETADPAPTVEEVMELIRQHGGRSTTPRRMVLETLIGAPDDHRTAEQLAAEVHTRNPTINESTVYRTLELLEELGLVNHVHLGHGPSQWHLSSNHPRWYLTCTYCGSVTDTDPAVFDALVNDVVTRTGFTIDSGHFAITGTCARCATPPD